MHAPLLLFFQTIALERPHAGWGRDRQAPSEPAPKRGGESSKSGWLSSCCAVGIGTAGAGSSPCQGCSPSPEGSSLPTSAKLLREGWKCGNEALDHFVHSTRLGQSMDPAGDFNVLEQFSTAPAQRGHSLLVKPFLKLSALLSQRVTSLLLPE